MKKHPLTNEYSRFGSFDMLAENNREQLKGLIVEIAAGQNGARYNRSENRGYL